MSSKSDDVIMILPTKNRQIYLNRVNDFYNSTELKLVILDSTTKKYEGIISKEIDYLHLPNHDVIEKFKLSLNKYSNYPYVVIGADDDFIFPRAIMECVKFLKNNNDFTTAQGYFMSFRKKGKFVIRPQYQETISINYSQQDTIKRFENYNKSPGTTYYAVHRSEIFKKSLNEMQKINLEECGLNMWELLLGYISIISGKHKILSTLYALRESWPEKSTGQLQPKLWDLRFNEKLIHNYHCILDIMVKEILRNVDKNYHDAKIIVEKTFEDYFATSMVRKKMGLDKIHPLNARIRNYFERLIGFACRNVGYFEKKIRPNDYTVNSTIYSNTEYQKEIASIVKLYYKYPVL